MAPPADHSWIVPVPASCPPEGKPGPLTVAVKLLQDWPQASQHCKCHTSQNVFHSLHPESLPLIPLLFPFLLSQTPFPPSTPIFSLLPPLTEALFSYLSHKTLFTCHLLQEVSHVPSGKKGPLSLLSLRFYVVTLCQAPKGAQARCQFITIYYKLCRFLFSRRGN